MNNIQPLIEQIIALHPLQASFVQNSVATLSTEDETMLNRYIGYCLNQGVSMHFLAQSYDLIVRDTFKEQVYFRRHKHYRYASYDEVAAAVYQSDEYMSKYMYGLALSAFLWPNHRALHHFFLSQLAQKPLDNYLEIGPGHGFYFIQSMQNTRFGHYSGVDISPTSVAMTRDIIGSGHFGQFDNYTIEQANFLDWPATQKYDQVVMAEVLEHVEQPLQFLDKIRQLLSDKGQAFITTCINAPAIDHIYLYQTLEQLTAQIEQANLLVTAQLVVPYTDLTLEQSMAQQLPVNVAMNLRAK